MKDLSIITVNWKSTDYLRKCLSTLYENTRGLDFEVVVVDTGSPDCSAAILKNEFPNIVIVHSQENLGFARANNLGFRQSSGGILLFLNPDTEVVGPAIFTMLSELQERTDAGAVGCRILNSDRTIQTSCIQRFPTILNQTLGVEWLRLLWPNLRLWGIRPLFRETQEAVPVDVVSGACLMIRRDVFERIGLFSDEYFMYAEDVDLCYKVRQSGLKSYYIGRAAIIHHGGGSSTRCEINHWTTILQRRAIFMFCRKTRGPFYAWSYRMAMGTSALCRLTILALFRPFAKTVLNGSASNSALGKWMAVFRWAIGLGTGSRSAAGTS